MNISRWVSDDKSGGDFEVDYLPWAFDQPNGLSSQKCLSFDSQRNGYSDEECSSKFCFPCQLPKDVFFNMRGLPIDLQDLFDTDYVVYIDPAKVGFDGFSGLSSVVWEPFLKRWQIVSLGIVVGSYNGTKSYPIGLGSWNFFLEQNVTHELKLTQVSNTSSSFLSLVSFIFKAYFLETVFYSVQ